MAIVDHPDIDALIQARSQLVHSIQILEQNALHIQNQCQSNDPDLVEPLEAIVNGLNEMKSLSINTLPSDLNQAQDMQSHLPDGGWHKFERKFIHDLRNPLGVALGYSEILAETVEDFMQEPEFQNASWLSPFLELTDTFSEQLQHFNQSLNTLFPQRAKVEMTKKVTTLVPVLSADLLSSKDPSSSSSNESQEAEGFESTSSTSLSTVSEDSSSISSSLSSSSRLSTSRSSPRTSSTHSTSSTSLPPLSHHIPPNYELPLSHLNSNDHTLIERKSARVLVVDDNQSNQDLLCSMLKREGHEGDPAGSARKAIEKLEKHEYDLILLDLVMPEISGDILLEQLKSSSKWNRLPIIMISGDTEVESAIRCIELGAEDYILKPFNRVLLKARIGACLDKKYLMDEMEARNQRFKELLNRVLPAPVVRRLDEGETEIADRFESTTILFSDLVGFTRLSAQLTPSELIRILDQVFSAFDEIAQRLGVEKIKTIGDAYMAAAGLPIARPDHADLAVQMGIEMILALERIRLKLRLPLQMRVGIHSGPVAAGIIGHHRFLYEVWGDTVNVASRLEASGVPSSVHLSSETQKLLKKKYALIDLGINQIKGKGHMQTYQISPFPV